CAIARSGPPGPVFVEVPANLYLRSQETELRAPVSPAPPPGNFPVAEVAEIINRMRRPLLYAGMGAVGAADLLLRLAERLEAPVATTFSGKGVFPETHPLSLWPGFGAAAPPFARE